MENNQESTAYRGLLVTGTVFACDFLAQRTGLPKVRIKDALTKGAVWLKRPGHKEKRLRKATYTLLPGDKVELYYDPQVLALVPPPPRLIEEERHYSVWFKPANLLTQGTRYGDHCSLLRWVELFYQCRKEVLPVHRLDREAYGLVLLAHSRQGASALSRLFREGRVEKRYRAEVHGKIGCSGETVTLAKPLDGKEAITIVTAISYDRQSNRSMVDIRLLTGRLHQIRRHLSGAGHPVVGDPRYGITGKTSDAPLQLCAYSLRFGCPFSKKIRSFSMESPSANDNSTNLYSES